jgi:hypothetical protein
MAVDDATTLELVRSRGLLAQWMIQNSFATGHGDSIESLLLELTWQVDEMRRQVDEMRDRSAQHERNEAYWRRRALGLLDALHTERERLSRVAQQSLPEPPALPEKGEAE